jgi:hypothetical protein
MHNTLATTIDAPRYRNALAPIPMPSQTYTRAVSGWSMMTNG